MFPSKKTLVAILALALVPLVGPAEAQTSPGPAQGSDLIVLQIDPAYAVAGLRSTVTVTIKNVGNAEFQTQTGWQLRYGYGNVTTGCGDVYPSASDQARTNACKEIFAPGTSEDAPYLRIGAGETRTWTLEWDPGVNLAGNGRLLFRIEPLQCSDGSGVSLGEACANPSGKHPDDHPENNVGDFGFFVRTPAVQAVPLRQATKNPNLNQPHANTPWSAGDITQDCPASPDEVAQAACRPQPGSVVTFAFKVRNLGNWVDTFSGQVVDPASPTNLTSRGYTFNFSPRALRLDAAGLAQSEAEVRLQVYVPASEKAGNGTNLGTIDQVVRWSSAMDPSVSTDHPPKPPCDPDVTPGLCQSPSFPSLLVGVRHSLEATTREPLHAASVLQEATFNLTLNNSGNAADRFRIEIDNATAEINASWLPHLPAFQDVGAFSAAKVTIGVTPPANATKGLHRFSVVVQSETDTEARTRTVLPFAVDVQQSFSISGGEQSTLIRALPAQKAAYVFNLRNDGNGPDNVTLRLDTPALPPGWVAQMTPSPILVPAFSTAQVHLNVTSAANAPEGYAASFYVNATSQDARAGVRFTGNLVVLGGPNLEVTAPAKTAFVDPGNATDYNLTVRNVGNKRSNFTVSVERQQDQLAWTADYAPGFVVLDPLQTGNVRVSLRAPGTGVVGETTRVFVTVRSTADPAIFNQTALEGQVSGPDLFVSNVLVNTTTPYSGDPVELSVVLGNAGNRAPAANATLKVYFVQGDVPRLVAQKEYAPTDLPGGRRATERVVWDTAGVEGPGVLLARIDEANEVKEIDDAPASNEASRPITLRTFDIHVTPAQGLSGLPGERVSYSDPPHVFILEYRGNQPSEPVDVYVTSEHGWGGARFSIALPRGSPVPVLVDVQIPPMPGVPEDALRLTVVPALRQEASVSAAATTTVVDKEKPVILGASAGPGIVSLGESVTITALVEDATGLSSVRAIVVGPDNVTQTVPLQRGPSGAWSRTQPFLAAGSYRLYVEAVDGSAARNANSTRDTVVSFTVAPGSAPRIELAGGQPATVRTGALVRVNVTDPLGIAKATYSIRGVSYDLPRPYLIDTSAWTNGTYDVNVTASNVYGVETTQKLTLVVDNSPPRIAKVQLTPAAPKANEDATLRVETDTRVESVQVVVKKDGQVVRTVDATRRGLGAFEVLLNPAEGSYVVDVAAKDAAGNVNLQQAAVSFSAKPASAFQVPGLGLVGALAALGLAGALLRRRLG